MLKLHQEALERGINLFNEQRFFEAHEEWEQEWRLMTEGEDKTFFQGLIYTAAAFLQYTRRECAGAKELLSRSLSSLRAGMDGHPDISVGQLIDDLTRLRKPFEACTFDLQERRLPIIHRNLVNW
jgi:predicted metal-dependent hydrolase